MYHDDEKLLEYLPVIMAIMSENPEYFAEQVAYDVEIKENKGTLLYTQFLFDDNVSPQLLCFKLVHNLAMISCYKLGLMAEYHISINELNLNLNKKYELKLGIRSENVDILFHKGFGLFGISVANMACALDKVFDAIIDYIKELSSTETDYDYLKRVSEFSTKLTTIDVNRTLLSFIDKNKDFYQTQINMVNEYEEGYDED